ncbi:GNAT family N-acetyltransferase [Acinetobacter qingfengensis]|uniref:Protein ElaA n=1 Tax=Acinetobacter qingfengensis TaxID=1262585 RepID=A0A1E7RDY5_9GAMM|nr:GNAT family N-acetyltransferase [Acinetobacter qingfengensis]KAA8733692.1 GNAT family N-acetyltransferase [Acinetobacter qingfengensis]OEY97493.1 GNAT family N-acetyltransferase [Acinetobacter qingfengensis]
MQLQWQLQHSSQLSLQQLYEILALRNQAFIVEQNCPYQDLDGLDLLASTYHVLAYRKEGKLVAISRLLDVGQAQQDVRIGRVVVTSEYRGYGVGDQLMAQSLQHAQQLKMSQQGIYLSAQAHLQHFYAKFGFQTVTEPYLEDEIPHVGMRNSNL